MRYENQPWYRPEFGALREHKSGHLIVKKGRFRDVAVHRAIVTLLLEEKPSPVFGNSLPAGFVVHHMDFDKKHNCPHNFILMEHVFHATVSAYGLPRYASGRWGRLIGKGRKIPQLTAPLDIDPSE